MLGDSTYILVVIGMIFCLIASFKVKGTFKKYSKVSSRSGLTGAQAAEQILNAAGIYDVSIKRIRGSLTDNYDSRNKVLSLSDDVYDKISVAAIGVAAHECGHAMQHDAAYKPLNVRSMLYPVASIGSSLSWILIAIGIFIGWFQPLITIGILFFVAAVAFQLVTLPVEFNASSRAIAVLSDRGILQGAELEGAQKVLKAAALTYIAGAAASVLQLVRLIILSGGRNSD